MGTEMGVVAMSLDVVRDERWISMAWQDPRGIYDLRG